MYRNILTAKQQAILPLIKEFSKDFYLVGGTAIALYIGHRHSIDFDLFTPKQIKRKSIKNTIEKANFTIDKIKYEAYDQLHLFVNTITITFFNFDYNVSGINFFEDIIKMPSLLDLAGMKAYVLGGRAKWKDYVDLYFLLKDHFSVEEISASAKKIFNSMFSEKLFRQELAYFNDIDYSEEVEFVGEDIPENEIKEFLKSKSVIIS